jgi:hypothetical protein
VKCSIEITLFFAEGLNFMSLNKQITRISVVFLAFQGLIFSNVANAENLTLSKISFPTMEIAQANQAEMILNQMNQSMTSAFEEIPTFINGLSYMETAAQSDQELAQLLQQLIPVVARITGNFAQAYQAGEQISSMLPPNSQERMIMSQLQMINGNGANTFAAWIDVLAPMQQALYSQNMNQFETAANQLPNVINQTMEFMNGVETIAQSYNNSANNHVAPSNNQDDLNRINTLSNIQSTMHNINMGILKNMDSNGEWRYNPATGQDEWNYY